MSNIYLAEDGTIHSCGGSSENTSSSTAQGPYANTGTCQAAAARKPWFWLYTIISSILVGIGAGALGGPIDLGDGGFLDFFEMILPYGWIGGAVLGAVLYGCNGAAGRCYNLGAYILSPLCAVAGLIAVGLVLCIVPYILIGIWYVFCICLAVGVVAAFVSGSD